ncbi:alcohol dehydrogenase catalytic domain-containing protein [Nocardia sp. NPDC058518]|uniref:alcohol dehydrogenase catalytic domain-containing protein n=1 Tax=Nocardia sp. NPDC058518 TaxID=3346534 RepID=UPI003660D24D
MQITASGICGSDLHYYRAEPDPRTRQTIAGHEPAGVVVALWAGVDPARVRIGDRVMVHHYAGCGGCAPCRAGWTHMCTSAPATVYGKNAHGARALPGGGGTIGVADARRGVGPGGCGDRLWHRNCVGRTRSPR